MSGRVSDAPPLTPAHEPPAEDEQQAFAELFDAHAAHVFDYCFSVLGDRERAAGAAQATLIAAHSLAGRLRDRSRTRAWLLALARRECQDSPSQRAVRNSASGNQRGQELTEALAFVDSADDDVTDAPTSQFSLRDIDEITAVSAMVAGLPAGEREVLNLVYRHEISPAELPAILGIPPAGARQLQAHAEASYAAAFGRLEADRLRSGRASRSADLADAIDQTGDIAAWADQTGDIAAWAVGSGGREKAADRTDESAAADGTGDLAGDLAEWADQTGDIAAWADQTGDLAERADQAPGSAEPVDQTGDIAAWTDQTGDIAAWADQTGDIAMWTVAARGPRDASPEERGRSGLAVLSAVPLTSLPPSVWRRTARAALDPRFQSYRDAVRAHAEHLGADGFPVGTDEPALPSFRRLLGSSAVLAGLLLAPAALGAVGYAAFGGLSADKIPQHSVVVPYARAPASYPRPIPTVSAGGRSGAPGGTAHSGRAAPSTVPSGSASTSATSQPSPSASGSASHSASPLPSLTPPPSASPTPTSPSPTSTSGSASPSSSAQASNSPAPADSSSPAGGPAASPSPSDSPSPSSS